MPGDCEHLRCALYARPGRNRRVPDTRRTAEVRIAPGAGSMKVAVIGCGLRTPLLIHGLAHSGVGVSQLVLYDLRPDRTALMAALGQEIAAGKNLQVSECSGLAEAVRDSSFVISSIRVGDMDARARDERISVECGFAGQETTGQAGFAMALRTIPVAIEHARLVE